MSTLDQKLQNLPAEPGVYFFKDAKGKIIYVGKAAVLKNRVKSYFLAGTVHGPKNQVLVSEIKDVDWIAVASEVEALFLESEFIKRYKPTFNVDLKDEKSFNYVKISADEFPVISYVRRPLDDKATYFGPFTSSDAMKRAMKLLRRVFPYVTHDKWPERACLHFHLGLCPGPEIGAISVIEYRRNIRNLVRYLKGERAKLVVEAEKEMKSAAKQRDYEAAAKARDRLRDMLSLSKQMVFGDKESFDLSKDQALAGLSQRLDIPIPRRIEAYDISHLQGSDNVASMIVFTDGAPNKDQYRRFKMRLRGNDDFGHMREVIKRRFSKLSDKDWPKPDLLLIDGGKGQLAAALSIMDELGVSIPAIGLAKREEEIIRRRPSSRPIDSGHYEDEAWITANQDFEVILLPPSSHVLQLLQRVRDEAHRFAVTYHALLRGKRQTKSKLDDIPGVGPATRKRLVKAFGSVRGVAEASPTELEAIVGPARAKLVKEHLR
ncbi:MAG TPA: excinuclease ABC subunit UvrC [Candidatus Nanoarchaeia archaeon]|nr:excinuclease ABC subunit UvrC [Candidatus Nanoarchaeia archaeon]